MTAPICNIPQESPLSRGQQPLPKTLPFIPEAVDLRSALMAINAMRQLMFTMFGGNNTGTSSPAVNPRTAQQQGGVKSGSQTPSGQKKQNNQGRFTEVNRVQETFKVPIQQDASGDGYVEFTRINRVDMQDNLTKELWTWTRG